MIPLIIVLACCIDSPAWQNPRQQHGMYMEAEGGDEPLEILNAIDQQYARDLDARFGTGGTPDHPEIKPEGTLGAVPAGSILTFTSTGSFAWTAAPAPVTSSGHIDAMEWSK